MKNTMFKAIKRKKRWQRGKRVLSTLLATVLLLTAPGPVENMTTLEAEAAINTGPYSWVDGLYAFSGPLLNKQNADNTALYDYNNITQKLFLESSSGGAWMHPTNSRLENNLRLAVINGGKTEWTMTYKGTGPYIDSPDIQYRISASLYNRGGYTTFGDGHTVNHYTTPNTSTRYMTPWEDYVEPAAVFSGNKMSEIRNVNVVLADLTSPGENGWSYAVEEYNGEPVLLVDFNEQLRPAAEGIKWEEVNEVLRLQLEMVSKSPNVKHNVTVTAEAIYMDNNYNRIAFRIIDEDKEKLKQCEYQIESITDVSDTTKSYTLYQMVSYTFIDPVTLYVNTPITDLAGNPLVLPTENVHQEKLIFDALSPSVHSIGLSGTGVSTEILTKDGVFPEGSSKKDLFAVEDKTLTIKVNLSELIETPSEKDMQNVKLVWNISENGAVIESPLVAVEETELGANLTRVSTLVFKEIIVSKDMTPQGVRVEPIQMTGTGCLVDLMGNTMSDTVTFDNMKPDKETYIDTSAPTMSVGQIYNRGEVDGHATFTVEMKISDGSNETNFMSSVEGKEGYVALTTYEGAPELKYEYEVTMDSEVPKSFPEANQGTVTSKVDIWDKFPMTGEGSYYLHFRLKNVGSVELDEIKGLTLHCKLEDNAGNASDEAEGKVQIAPLGIDHVGPKLSLTSQGVSVKRDTQSQEVINIATFTNRFSTTDVNGIERVEYQWVDEGGTPIDNAWQIVTPSAEEKMNFQKELTDEVTGLDRVSRDLVVRAYDVKGNMTESRLNANADLSKAVGRYEVVGNAEVPANDTDIRVYKPTSSGNQEEGTQYYTRATLTMGNNTWVKVFDFNGYDSALLLDKNASDWYKVSVSNNTYKEVEAGTTPDWNYYGTVSVSFASGMQNLVPVVNEAVNKTEDITLGQDGSVSYQYTSKQDDAYDVTFKTYTDRLGNAMEMTTVGIYRYYLANQTMAGVRIPFDVSNILIDSWTVQDIDYNASYAVLLRVSDTGKVLTDENGVIDPASEMTERISLSAGKEQIFTIPEKDKNGNDFTSGAYTLYVHLVQQAGGVQDFYNEINSQNVCVLLDASKVPERFGVLEYSANAEVISTYISGEYNAAGIPWGKQAREGEVLSSINIGVAKPDRYYGHITQEAANIVEIAGHPAYALEVSNSLISSREWDGGHISFDLAAQQPDENTGRFLGTDIGKVAGIKYWNAASQGNPKELAYEEGSYFYEREYEGGTEYGLTVYERLNHYTDDEDDRQSVIIVSEEEVKQKSIDDFALVLGSNTIKYQLIMENGTESPVYQFKLNLYEEAPAMELEYEFVNSNIVKDEEVTTNGRRYAEQINVKVTDVFSPNGGAKIYLTEYNEDTNTWSYTEYEQGESIPLTQNGDGYLGSSTTSVGSMPYYENPSLQIISVVDSVGNAISAFPILNADTDMTDEKYYYGIKNTGDPLTVTAHPETNSLVFNEDTSVPVSDTVEYFTIQLDDRTPVRVEGEHGGFWGNQKNFALENSPNEAGIVSYGTTSDYGQATVLTYALPYDEGIAEGEMVKHTFKIVAYGYSDELGTGFVKEFDPIVVEGINQKPTLAIQARDPEYVSFNPGDITLESNSYLKRVISPEDTQSGYYKEERVNVYRNGVHTFEMEDKFGQRYEFDINVTDFDNQVQIKFSETNPTDKPVTVQLTSSTYKLYASQDEMTNPVFANGTVNGNETGNISLIFNQSYATTVYAYKGDDYYDYEQCFYIVVDNIYDDEFIPEIQWSYTGDAMNREENIVYDEVVARLIDKEGNEIIDPMTGTTPSYTFPVGSNAGDTYVFKGYKSVLGKTGPDMTATLPYNLRLEPLETEVPDTYSPDVAITGYNIRNGESREVLAAYKLVNDRSTADYKIILPDYENEAKYGAKNVYGNMDRMLAKMGFGDSYMFRIDTADESTVRLFVKKNSEGGAPDYTTGMSDSIEGVSLQGRTLSVEGNKEFVLYAVDMDNNASEIPFNITLLGDIPEPNYAQVLTKENEVRVYLLAPYMDGVTNVKITNDDNNDQILDAKTEDNVNSVFYGKDYITVTENKDLILYYSYVYDGQTYTGELKIKVDGIDLTVPEVENKKWSLNYDSSGVKLTNQEISAQFDMNRNLASVTVIDDVGTEIMAPDGVAVSYLEDKITVVYEKNAPAMHLRVVGSGNGLNSVIDIPAVTTIDTTKPDLQVSAVSYSENHKSAYVTVLSDEDVTLQDASGVYNAIKQLKAGESLKVVVKENGELNFRITDKAGNVTNKNVVVTDIVTEDLLLVLQTADGTPINPSTDTVNVGDTVYAVSNRAAEIYLNGNSLGTCQKDTAFPITIREDAEGLYPSIHVEDAYKNTAIVQLLKIPMKDRSAPVLLVSRSVISAAVNITDADLEELLLKNVVAQDETTQKENLVIDFTYTRPTAVGVMKVDCSVTDEAGNTVTRDFNVRFYEGAEPGVFISHSGTDVNETRDERKVIWEDTILVSPGTVQLEVDMNGEPYKVDYKAGIKTVAQMKINSTALTGYTNATNETYELTLNEPGYYTVLISTQGRATYRFVIYVEELR